MKYTRRMFLQTGAIAMAGTSLLRNTSPGAGKKDPGTIALQLYSIRDDMMRDPMDSLTRVAAMGYACVEHANYVGRKFYGFTAPEFRKILDDLGLRMISGHTVMGRHDWDAERNDFSDGWKRTIDDAATLGQQYVISPSMDAEMRKTHDGFLRCLDVFNRSGDLCHARGMKFGYHNHDVEFIESFNGEPLFDIIMRAIDPDRVVLQLDIGNMYNGGATALDVVHRYPGRFELIHVKDEIRPAGENGRFVSTILGEGIVHAKDVIELAARIGGSRVFVVEQEDYQDVTPMESIETDLKRMKAWGY